MTQLQTPEWAYMEGAVVPWSEARIHIGSEALIRGISVFEGIKGYWNHDRSEMRLLALREHFERLRRSASLQHLPFEVSYAEFLSACSALVGRLKHPGKDLWIRPTVLSIDGYWGEFTVTDLVITCYNQEIWDPTPIDVGVRTWQRPQDNAQPARIKSAANYQVARMARIEGRRQGFADMILLNSAGRVSEATGSCVLIARDGCVVTPPPYEGCLESITVNIVAALCATLGIPFERRPVERTELLIADGVCLAGTLTELTSVRRIEGHTLPDHSPEFDSVRKAYFSAVRGESPHPTATLTAL